MEAPLDYLAVAQRKSVLGSDRPFWARNDRVGKPGAAYLTFEFADAPLELMVELTLADQMLRLSRERALGRGEFFGKQRDLHLLRAGSMI